MGQAKRFSSEIIEGVKRSGGILKQLALKGLRQELESMLPLVRQVMRQTRERIFRGNTRAEGKLLSVFEPSTEIIRKGKATYEPARPERGATFARVAGRHPKTFT